MYLHFPEKASYGKVDCSNDHSLTENYINQSDMSGMRYFINISGDSAEKVGN